MRIICRIQEGGYIVEMTSLEARVQRRQGEGDAARAGASVQ